MVSEIASSFTTATGKDLLNDELTLLDRNRAWAIALRVSSDTTASLVSASDATRQRASQGKGR